MTLPAPTGFFGWSKRGRRGDGRRPGSLTAAAARYSMDGRDGPCKAADFADIVKMGRVPMSRMKGMCPHEGHARTGLWTARCQCTRGYSMRYLVAASFFIFLISCTSTENYEKILDSSVGSPEVELVRSWGAPQQVYETGGRRFLTYSDSRQLTMPGTAPTYQTTVIGSTAYTSAIGGTPARNVNLNCETTFEVEGSLIIAWSHRGNSCRS